MSERVVILGASNNPERYAHRAFWMLKDYGHVPVPVNPALQEMEGVKVFHSLSEVEGPVDTLTMYVGPEKSSRLKEEILNLHPKRVIFNPGSENPDLMRDLKAQGVEVVEGCTLVMLRTSQF